MRESRADGVNALHVELPEHHGIAVRGLGEDRSPRIDDHRAPVGPLAPRLLPEVAGADQVALVLHRPGAQQKLPVVAAGGERERGRHHQQLGPAQREDPVQLGEAQVVTDAQADGPALHVHRHDLLPRILHVGLTVNVAGDVNVEEVDLPVGREDIATRAHHHARVRQAPGVRSFGDRAANQVNLVLPSPAAESLHGLTALQVLRAGAQDLGRAEPAPLLRQNHQTGPGGRSSGDQLAGPCDVRRLVRPGAELHPRHAERARALP